MDCILDGIWVTLCPSEAMLIRESSVCYVSYCMLPSIRGSFSLTRTLRRQVARIGLRPLTPVTALKARDDIACNCDYRANGSPPVVA